jgi:hypothetical protein
MFKIPDYPQSLSERFSTHVLRTKLTSKSAGRPGSADVALTVQR